MALRIGTRGSPLALVQANEVKRRLIEQDPGLLVEIVVIRTTGDRVRDRPLSEIGGKGLFTKEIEEALLDGGIDLAVHSMKDMPTRLPDGLGITSILPREDPRDALLGAASVSALPRSAVVGTSSLRRKALLLHHRPDLRIVGLRGNVDTRLKKLEAGEMDATILAAAGLNRLGFGHLVTAPLGADIMLPAVAQGAVGIEIRLDDAATGARVAAIDHRETHLAVRAERAMLAALDGSCRTPIAGHATLADGVLTLDGMVVKPDGSAAEREMLSGPANNPESLGHRLGEALLARTGPDYMIETTT